MDYGGFHHRLSHFWILTPMKKILHNIKKWRDNLQKPEEVKFSRLPPPPLPEDKLVVEISIFSVFKATLVIIGVIFLSNIFVELLDIIIIFLIE